ncbi:MAG: aspartate-semialdehyde dehydrogenase, partial [Spirochaetia bacterium]
MARKEKYNVAVVGALGMVGTEMIRTLERRGFPIAEFRPLDIPENAGKTVEFNGSPVEVQAAVKENFAGIDIAIFSAGGDASKELAPQAVEMGAVVVDNSSQWRMDPE